MRDDNLMKRLSAMFKVEAQEHVQAIAAGLVELERSLPPEEQARVLDTTFRAAHSLKGAARTIDAKAIETLCQSLESVFAALKRARLDMSAELFDLLHRLLNTLGSLAQAEPPVTALAADALALVHALQGLLLEQQPGVPGAAPAAGVVLATAAPAREQPLMAADRRTDDTIRVATAKLDAVLLEAEELVSAKLAAGQQAQKLRACHAGSTQWSKRWRRLAPDLRQVGRALEQPGAGDPAAGAPWRRVQVFLQWSQQHAEALEHELKLLARSAEQHQRAAASSVDALLDDMKKVVMQPVATLLDIFPRLVRELAREQGKRVELSVRGGEIEVDRRVLEQIKDPLIHMVRNCVDHGIELPTVRQQQSKPAAGTLHLEAAAHDSGSVRLTIADDGRGIDAALVKAAAIRQGAITAEAAEALDAEAARALIFHSGVSTSPLITDISGRGLGLAIVKSQVERLGGALELETRLGAGTAFRITLPLTLTRFRGTLVAVDEALFVLPTNNVARVLRLAPEQIRTVENRETALVNGRTLALVPLATALGMPLRTTLRRESARRTAVVVTAAGPAIAFAVDAVLEEQEVLVKPLGPQLQRVRNIAGATILGNGKVVPILNVADLLSSAMRAGASAAAAAAATAAERRKSVLVAEDSITSRILLKNILEAAGYEVETAADGMDALAKARNGSFDAVVSDVEMPRLTGFDLTARLRADARLRELPVVLVTALDSREDRERGIDVGANAYIVKSSFDQSNLVAVLQRLV